ncbi:MAG: TetR/AcrR family transcriptional regulator [Rhizobiaceae bacterium]|nr:TetR/AcrR family transcriptional regulator [Rhizobiaceae bacterium]
MLESGTIDPDALAAQPSGRTQRREAQVARIVEAARACFLRSGFHGASMGDICAEAGMSPGALYRYFPSKESLIEAICAADRDEDAKILIKIAEAESVVDGMTDGLVAHVEQMHRSGLAPLFSEIFAEANRNPAIHKALDNSMCDAERVIFEAMKAAQDRGEIAPVAPLDVLLQSMMAMGQGIVTHDLPRRGISPDTLRPVIHAMVVALLRPTEKSPKAKSGGTIST